MRKEITTFNIHSEKLSIRYMTYHLFSSQLCDTVSHRYLVTTKWCILPLCTEDTASK